MKSTKGEAVRFLITGGANTVLTYLIYLALLDITDYRIAFTSSFIAGIFIAYSLNALFVFKTALSVRKMIQYPLIYALQYALGLLLLGILVDNFGIDKRFAPLINVLLLTPITFMLNKWFLLKKVTPVKQVVSFEKGYTMVSRSIDECKILQLPKITDPRGNLTFIENSCHIPFDIKRVYYLYDVPGGSDRGSHAHKQLHQFIIAISGSFDVELDDGKNKKRFHLNRSYYGLYVCPMMWRLLDNFSSGSVCLVLSSETYSEDDYIREYDSFISAVRERA